MKRKTYSQEQIIRILKEHEAGTPANEVIRKHGIANSATTWRQTDSRVMRSITFRCCSGQSSSL